MKVIDVYSSKLGKCVVCRKKNGHYMAFGYVDGIEIVVPLCDKYRGKVCAGLFTAMDAHLKSISSSINMSIIFSTMNGQ